MLLISSSYHLLRELCRQHVSCSPLPIGAAPDPERALRAKHYDYRVEPVPSKPQLLKTIVQPLCAEQTMVISHLGRGNRGFCVDRVHSTSTYSATDVFLEAHGRPQYQHAPDTTKHPFKRTVHNKRARTQTRTRTHRRRTRTQRWTGTWDTDTETDTPCGEICCHLGSRSLCPLPWGISEASRFHVLAPLVGLPTGCVEL